MKTCLIVDDSKIVRKVIKRIIEPLGFAILEAEHGEEALVIAKSHALDLIMLDWNMPIMSGLDFLRTLRATASIAQPKVIFCTTETAYDKIEAAMKAGADEYVMKPFDEAIIIGKLMQLGLAD